MSEQITEKPEEQASEPIQQTETTAEPNLNTIYHII